MTARGMFSRDRISSPHRIRTFKKTFAPVLVRLLGGNIFGTRRALIPAHNTTARLSTGARRIHWRRNTFAPQERLRSRGGKGCHYWLNRFTPPRLHLHAFFSGPNQPFVYIC